jgi:hypothetical protein
VREVRVSDDASADAPAEGQRRIVFEVPSDVTLSDEEIASITAELGNQLIDTRSETIVVSAKPKEKVKEVPQLVQIKEVGVAKTKQQTA